MPLSCGLEEAVVGFRQSDAHPDTLTRKGTHRQPDRLAGMRETACEVARAQPDEVRLGFGWGKTGGEQACLHPLTLPYQEVHALQRLTLASQCSHSRRLRDR